MSYAAFVFTQKIQTNIHGAILTLYYMHQNAFNTIFDMIKGNESDVANIDFEL